jgi:hypothetical protein
LKEYENDNIPDRVLNVLDRLNQEYREAKGNSWYLRSDVIWFKPNPMPESVQDRCTKSHEYIFMLTKSGDYFYDSEAVKEPSVDKESYTGRRERNKGKITAYDPANYKFNGSIQEDGKLRSGQVYPNRNLRDVWRITTNSYKEAHFATFPLKIPEICIKAGTSEKGCCPKCGAPWERVIQKDEIPSDVYTNTRRPEDVSAVMPNGKAAGIGRKMQEFYNDHPIVTVGWQPGCKCEAGDPVPCKVLDPFNGSGTTGVMAVKLGRDYVGIDLNPDYIEMTRKRLAKGVQLELV